MLQDDEIVLVADDDDEEAPVATFKSEASGSGSEAVNENEGTGAEVGHRHLCSIHGRAYVSIRLQTSYGAHSGNNNSSAGLVSDVMVRGRDEGLDDDDTDDDDDEGK